MKHKGIIARIGALGSIALLLLVAFVGIPTTANGDCGGEKTEWEAILWAGQNIEVGYVEVTFDTANFYVKYVVTGNWYITETHLALSLIGPDGIPQTKSGSPKVGHFAFKGEHDYVQDVLYTIPFTSDKIVDDDKNGFEWGECICIAAHAVVEKKCGDTVVDQQTAWGEGNPFEKSWAMYFCFKPIRKLKPSLPDGEVTYWIKHIGTNCYWDVKITGGSSDTDNVPDDIRINGWCADTKHTINGGDHTGTLDLYEGTNYQIVNYILNEVDRTTNNWESLQAAIWWFIESKAPQLGGYVSGVNLNQDELDDANAIIDDAEHHGDYYPIGEYPVFAVWITHINTGSETGTHQAIIIEIDP